MSQDYVRKHFYNKEEIIHSLELSKKVLDEIPNSNTVAKLRALNWVVLNLIQVLKSLKFDESMLKDTSSGIDMESILTHGYEKDSDEEFRFIVRDINDEIDMKEEHTGIVLFTNLSESVKGLRTGIFSSSEDGTQDKQEDKKKSKKKSKKKT